MLGVWYEFVNFGAEADLGFGPLPRKRLVKTGVEASAPLPGEVSTPLLGEVSARLSG